MKKFLLFAFLVFLVTGCAEDTTNNNSTTEGQTSQEQLNKVDDAFTNEYKKYGACEKKSVNSVFYGYIFHILLYAYQNKVIQSRAGIYLLHPHFLLKNAITI